MNSKLRQYEAAFPTCEKHKPRGGTRSGCLLCHLEKYDVLFWRLDRAMATPERIAKDTAAMGEFVSGLDLTYGAEDIVNRAIKKILDKQDDL
jgi:hypothetical protein